MIFMVEGKNMNWEKAEKCEHKNVYPNYHVLLPCTCGKATEYHCKDCGVFFSYCGCHEQDGMSGWSAKQWKNFYKKKNK